MLRGGEGVGVEMVGEDIEGGGTVSGDKYGDGRRC